VSRQAVIKTLVRQALDQHYLAKQPDQEPRTRFGLSMEQRFDILMFSSGGILRFRVECRSRALQLCWNASTVRAKDDSFGRESADLRL